MYKKFFLSLLSFASLATVAQAGHLELTADLSEEQKAVVCKKFVEPYQEKYQGEYFNVVIGKGFNESVVGLYRPYITPLKEMSFNTTLASNIQVDEAKMIAKAYIDIANKSGANKVSTSPYLNGNESIGTTKHEKIADRFKLLSENPSQEELESLQVRDLGIFCKGDQLFCKTYDQKALEIKSSENDRQNGIPLESFQGLFKAVKEGDKDINLMYGPTVRRYTSSKDGYTIRNNEKVHVKNHVSTNPAIISTWNKELIDELGSEIENLQHKVNSFGSIYFSETSMETEGQQMGLTTNTCEWASKVREMELKIGRASLEMQEDVTLHFTNLKLTYVPYGNEGDVGFTIPLTFGAEL
jgi:hypothetical protein